MAGVFEFGQRIAGSHCRPVVHVNFNYQIVYVMFVATHAEYV
jgi:mRNA-degrading endonuclease HigB of HigAB toxin-antitoxin module